MTKVLNKRGTRSEINSAATANGLNAGEVYLITDENRIAMGTSANTYESYAKESEAGGGGGTTVLAFANFDIVNGELIVEHLSSFNPSIVDGEFIVEYTPL
jgi:hypothetical protein